MFPFCRKTSGSMTAISLMVITLTAFSVGIVEVGKGELVFDGDGNLVGLGKAVNVEGKVVHALAISIRSKMMLERFISSPFKEK